MMGKLKPESPIFDGKTHGFRLRFPLNQSSDQSMQNSSIQMESLKSANPILEGGLFQPFHDTRQEISA